MQQSGGLRGHKLPTKTACDQEKSFHFQCTWIISTVWLFWMPQWLGVAPWRFLFSSFSIDYSSVFQSKQEHKLQSNLLPPDPSPTRHTAFPQGPAPPEEGIKAHHKTWIFIPAALQHEEFPSLFLSLKEKGAQNSLLVLVERKYNHYSTCGTPGFTPRCSTGSWQCWGNPLWVFGVTPGVIPAAQGPG